VVLFVDGSWLPVYDNRMRSHRLITCAIVSLWGCGGLISTCTGGVVLCVENQGPLRFEGGRSIECHSPDTLRLKDHSTLTGNSCRHYPIQSCTVHLRRSCASTIAELLFYTPPFYDNLPMSVPANMPLTLSRDTLRSVVLII
jgi:hypothetical protein